MQTVSTMRSIFALFKRKDSSAVLRKTSVDLCLFSHFFFSSSSHLSFSFLSVSKGFSSEGALLLLLLWLLLTSAGPSSILSEEELILNLLFLCGEEGRRLDVDGDGDGDGELEQSRSSDFGENSNSSSRGGNVLSLLVQICSLKIS